MDTNFWHQKWLKNEIAFHEDVANPLLLKYINKLPIEKGGRIFIPLCGKTLDIGWLLSKGYRVVGVELVEMAIQQLFAELGVDPTITEVPSTPVPIKQYSAHYLDIFVGDIFQISAQILGQVDAVYDRAALVALPKPTRDHYVPHIKQITHTAPQLLISFEYDQTAQPGPPFAIDAAGMQRYYGDSYTLTLLESTEVEGGLKGKCPALEVVWLLDK